MITKNYYEILLIPITATPAEIKAAYRKRAREAHPDHGGTSFVDVNEAYQVLGNPTTRAAYDEQFMAYVAQHALYPCPGCGTANRVGSIPDGRKPVCGRCKRLLNVDEAQRQSQLKETLLRNLGGLLETVGVEAILLVQDAAVAGIGSLRGKLRAKRG